MYKGRLSTRGTIYKGGLSTRGDYLQVRTIYKGDYLRGRLSTRREYPHGGTNYNGGLSTGRNIYGFVRTECQEGYYTRGSGTKLSLGVCGIIFRFMKFTSVNMATDYRVPKCDVITSEFYCLNVKPIERIVT